MSRHLGRIGRFTFCFALLGVVVAIGWLGSVAWRSRNPPPPQPSETKSIEAADTNSDQPVRLTRQAQRNLRLVSKPLKLTTFWRTIDVPGVLVDRPGISNRGVVAPITGIITRIYHFPGDVVEPEAPIFDVRLVSESLYASQLELFKATREIEIAEKQRDRLDEIAQAGIVAQSRIIDIDNQIQRLGATVQAYEQDLKARGMSPDRIEAASKGEFLTEFVVKAPGAKALQAAEIALASATISEPGQIPFAFELQELKVELGQQVEAGHVLCTLADHRTLMIEGRGFKEDMPFIQAAAKNGWEIEVEYEVPIGGEWPSLPDKLQIHHVANTIDAESRTFAFYLALDNQWHSYSKDGKTRLLWRFRPGDRVRLRVAIEKFEKVFVLPQEAVVREGPEAFVFRQNGEYFDRRPVHVLYEDRRDVVLANDGSLREGIYFAQNAAASINRVMKAQAASDTPSNVHVHPDGTVHADH